METGKLKVKKGAKIIMALLIVGALIGLKWLLVDSEYIFSKEVKQTVQVNTVVLPDAPKDIKGGTVEFAGLPTADVANVNAPRINFEIMAWNSQMGLNLANGGPLTTKGSLMEKNNVNLSIKRQDDCNQMAANLIKFANDYKNNPSTAVGTNFVAIMGDGAPAFLSGVNAELSKLGDEYIAQIVYSCGKSNGEDQFMAPPAVKENPQVARGLVCSAFLRDGDWNIVIKWCADNGIPVNTDEKTYNPDAMNFVAANDFIDAAQKYITGYSEERAVVKTDAKTGKTTKTGEKKKVTVNCSTTWTPADVMIAENKGGLVRIVSTAEYSSQMPNVVIGIKKWLQDSRKHVEGMITGIAQAGDQIKTYPEALAKAGEISAAIYKEKDGAYWVKYYRGVTQSDAQGNMVSLGGSKVFNLSDNLELFGIGENKTNVYASVYKVFGDVVSSIYPEFVKTYPEITEVLDLSYILNVKSRSTNLTSADKVVYNNTGALTQTVAKRAWTIEFETGSARFTSKTENTLEDLYNQLNIASGLQIEIFGHTDNTGTSDGNDALSQSRADAVKNWLQQKSNSNYPNSRFAQVKGKGQNEPIADNNTANGKAKNRRVEIVMGK
jgi:outer membrane protein OmpA-like peptidoglycan-associated protein